MSITLETALDEYKRRYRRKKEYDILINFFQNRNFAINADIITNWKTKFRRDNGRYRMLGVNFGKVRM
ncbi:hypothetical protein SAMN02745885_02702 [Carboxydocella sporoproducens DSM 16521]|uniref:Uncharacterized protein n=2 Tax=Carboxydocella TaxID=178898 RepID=A0A1T4SIP6_9FIRM|nr:hypothetical protein CFE_0566 [Carboxydocella thermautotrophica]AVX30175.1 hypothetical protein CTH_0572 [Carboxydocella thermautotrophica]SKA28092.1 hypothetical protein SAMN02745885_02702 [Carboxydocella sporoproducens DSM 16521]